MVKNSSLAGYALCFVAGFGLGFVYHHIASFATSNEPVDAARMRSFETRLAQLEARLRAELSGASGDTGFATTVRGVVARLTETPTNFHQATVHFLATDAPQDAAMARWAPLLYAGSLAMVGLQSATAVGVFYGTTFPSCATSDQCGAGTFCEVGMGHRCEYCGNGGPVSGDDIGNLTFVVSKNGSDEDRLPSAHTCFNHLLLPEYQTLEQCTKQMVKAVNDTEGFHIV